MPSNSKPTEFGLTPEAMERIRRIAKATTRMPASVLDDAVLEYWIRYATKRRLKKEEW